VAFLPGLMAEAPAPISAGVLGIARTTRMPSPVVSSIASVVIPAATDSSRFAPARAAASAAATTTPGLTASSAPSASTASAVTMTPG
jgi:hypothetical protein